MGTVLLGRAHRHDERRSHPQALAYRDGGHFLQTPGALVLSHRARCVGRGRVGGRWRRGEWLRQPCAHVGVDGLGVRSWPVPRRCSRSRGGAARLLAVALLGWRSA